MKKEQNVNTYTFEVAGPYACFSNPMFKIGSERTSLEIPSVSAIKGICDNIYWHPAFFHVPDAIRILNDINQREISLVSGQRVQDRFGRKDLHFHSYLKNVRYQITGHIEPNPAYTKEAWNAKKHLQIFRRALKKGGRRPIYLGTSDCPAVVKPCSFQESEGFYDQIESVDFGIQPHSFLYPDHPEKELRLALWHPVMKQGVIPITPPKQIRLIKKKGE